MQSKSTVKLRVIKVDKQTTMEVEDYVAAEAEISIEVNAKLIATVLATPTQVKELCIGFLFSNGLIDTIDDIYSIKTENHIVQIEANLKRSVYESIFGSGCSQGIIFKSSLTPTTENYHIDRETVVLLMSKFQEYSSGYKLSGGLHSAAIARLLPAHILFFSEDVGRHNAVDKVLGMCLYERFPLVGTVLIISGRITTEVVMKVLRAGIGIVLSRCAPTDNAVKLASRFGLTIIGFARANRMNIYSGYHRVLTEKKPNSNKKYSSSKYLSEKIQKLKKAKQAIILAHNYQGAEVQMAADFVGDSLDLSRKAASTNAKIIVFCGVYFMAEIAKILSPEKLVLLPDKEAYCPLAQMLDAKQLIELKEQYPDAVVVSYVNSSAQVKALSDICCTSANSINVIRSIPNEKDIIFVPDFSLGEYVSSKCNRKLILHYGYCSTHHRILKEDIIRLKEEHPEAKVLVHPECTSDVRQLADAILSTNGMVRYVKETNASEYIIATEIGIINRLQRENPNKTFYPASQLAICPNMKLITLEKVLWALEDELYSIDVPENIAQRARAALQRMLTVQ